MKNMTKRKPMIMIKESNKHDNECENVIIMIMWKRNGNIIENDELANDENDDEDNIINDQY